MPFGLGDIRTSHDSIAGRVADYTDLDLTVGTGEYYLKDYEGEGNFPTFVGWDSAGSLSKQMDQWTQLAVSDTFTKAWALSSESNRVRMLSHKQSISANSMPLTLDIHQNNYDSIENVTLYTSSPAYSRAAVKGDWHKIGEYSDTNSIFQVRKSTPIWVINDGEFHAFPAGDHFFKLSYLAKPANSITVVRNTVEGGEFTEIVDVYNEVEKGDDSVNGARAPIGHRKIAAFAHTFIPDVQYENNTTENYMWYQTTFESMKAEGRYVMEVLLIRAVALKVASLLLNHRMMSMQKDLPKNVDYASLSSSSIAADTSHGWERVRFYVEEEEDSELTQALIGSLNAEQQSFVLRYQWYQQQKGLVESLYSDIFMSENLEQKRETGQV
tara:strand:- start:3188 stop:4336 length:1149 start_codon:yes stop_codon:yes gene_type:complete